VTKLPAASIKVGPIYGFNPFPTSAALVGWVRTLMSVWDGVEPGVYVLSSDLDANDLVLLRAQEHRRQVAQGANFVKLCRVHLADREHLKMMDRMMGRYE
jgi:hypothetical protein